MAERTFSRTWVTLHSCVETLATKSRLRGKQNVAPRTESRYLRQVRLKVRASRIGLELVTMAGESTEQRLMLAGELYRPADPALVAARQLARARTRVFNASTEQDPPLRERLLRELLGSVGASPEVEPPLYLDYGFNIALGDRVFINIGCVLLDCNRITIGDRTLLGPGVHIYAATHPVDPEVRASGPELALPVTIGSDVWIGGGAIICPGVEIGDGAVIGAGSVVTRNIPARSIAAGIPCRVIRNV